MNEQDIVLTGGTVVTPFRSIPNGRVHIAQGKIYAIGDTSEVAIPAAARSVDLTTHTILPGFVDLLAHGGGGFGFSDGTVESVREASAYFLRHGTTTMLAGLHAKPRAELLEDCRLVARFIRENPESNLVGIHLEGPYLHPDLRGAMNADHLWKPDPGSFRELLEAAQGAIKIMTIAPELPGAMEIIREASFRNILCSIGHSTADYATVDQAVDNGAAHVTHMFNAMHPLHHRRPGVATAALLHDEIKIELIADTVHVHPAFIQLLLKIKGPKGIILITDSIRAGGLHSHESHFSEQPIFSDGKRIVLKDGTLAGSVLTLNRAVRNIVQTTHAPLTDAARMASLNPSKVIRAQRGILGVGKVADLVALDDEYNVVCTIKNGRLVHARAQ